MNKIIETILKMNEEELSKVISYVKERRSQISAAKRLEFSIDDQVWIDHKQHGKSQMFIIEGINQKTISVKSQEGFKRYRVPPAMLNKFM